jgi:hypothetical protein
MAIRHDLRPDQDLDTSSYASLPGTRPEEFVPHNSTPVKDKIPSKAWQGMSIFAHYNAQLAKYDTVRMSPFQVDI